MARGELLAIDLGTLSAKVGLYSASGDEVAFARRSYSVQRGSAGLAEQDPEQWWRAVSDAISEVLSAIRARELRAICVGGQGPTLVLVDESGRPVRPAISWMDSRSTQIGAELSERLGGGRVAYSILPKLLWVAKREPTALERSRWALQAWDFVAYRLSGGSPASTTIAGDRVWPRPWLEAAEMAATPLAPPHVDAGAAYAVTGGPWALDAGVPEGVPVIAGMNDGIAAIVGAAGAVVGRATDPGGASAGLGLCTNRSVAAPGVDCWPGLVPGTYVAGGAFAAGGRALDWWAAAWASGDVGAVLTAAQRSVPGSGGTVFMPFLDGERSPLWDEGVRGAFVGLSLAASAADLSRAVLESAGYSLRLLADAIETGGGRIDQVRLCGRQAQSAFWNRVKTDILGRPVVVPRVVEVALMGFGILAAIGAGLHNDVVSAGEAMVQVAEALEPDPANRAVYESRFATYRAAYPALRSLANA